MQAVNIIPCFMEIARVLLFRPFKDEVGNGFDSQKYRAFEYFTRVGVKHFFHLDFSALCQNTHVM